MRNDPIDAHRACDHRALCRRRVLGGLAAAGAVALAGCGSGTSGSDDVDPIDASEAQCDVCGMVIGEQFGPSAQVFYADNAPDDHANPARFDALSACLFPYYFEKEGRGWTATAVFVTDYSSVDYDVLEREGTRYVTGHAGPDGYARADAVSLVVGSGLHGAMGPDAIPFAEPADADAFRDEYGGEVLAFDDVEPGTFSRA